MASASPPTPSWLNAAPASFPSTAPPPARLAPGDILIIATFATYTEVELAKHEPQLIYVDSQNRIARIGNKIPAQAA